MSIFLVVIGLCKHIHMHEHTHDTHTKSSPSEKRMAQQSPGHNASLHPLISAERIERRRKKGRNREVGGQRAKRRRKRKEKVEKEKCPQSSVNRGTQREKTAGKTRREKETRKTKGRKVDRRGGKRARSMAQQREEKEECMFASHLQWRRTA